MTETLCKLLSKYWLAENFERIHDMSAYIEEIKPSVDRLLEAKSVESLLLELKCISERSCSAIKCLESCIKTSERNDARAN